jgi:hypothetical protein
MDEKGSRFGNEKIKINFGHVHYPEWELLIGQKVKKGQKNTY